MSSELRLQQWGTDSGRRGEIEVNKGRNLRYGRRQPLVIGKQTQILNAANLEILVTLLGILSVRRLSGCFGLQWNFGT